MRIVFLEFVSGSRSCLVAENLSILTPKIYFAQLQPTAYVAYSTGWEVCC